MKPHTSSALRFMAFATVLVAIAGGQPSNQAPQCSADALRSFNGKVHIVLQNACLNCHATTKTGFQLQRGAASANLAAVLAQVDRNDPSASPLLRQAILAHGGATRPPLKDANAPAYKYLEAWVRLVANPLKENDRVDQDTAEAPANAKPARIRESYDPFDPEIFNRISR